MGAHECSAVCFLTPFLSCVGFTTFPFPRLPRVFFFFLPTFPLFSVLTVRLWYCRSPVFCPFLVCQALATDNFDQGPLRWPFTHFYGFRRLGQTRRLVGPPIRLKRFFLSGRRDYCPTGVGRSTMISRQ